MTKRFFVTGTNTGVGKTLISTALLAAGRDCGLTTVGLKPVAAGCEATAEGLRNADALALFAQSSLPLSYEEVNPVALAPAIAPHIAAAEAGRRLSAERLAGFCRGIMMQPVDLLLVEGAGGWRVPLNERETFADLAKILQLPVILVVAMELGCINHTLLSAEAIQRDGLSLAGWVANQPGSVEMDRYQETLASLQARLPCPMIGAVPWLPDPIPEQAAPYLKTDLLMAKKAN
ncbi:dethiobiotin synthase [Porticoccus sp.]|uniref:dethiobiotin synthase n=1 Tax=Porticoccus sp. TaxID=2024853 RepID=UPI003F69547E